MFKNDKHKKTVLITGIALGTVIVATSTALLSKVLVDHHKKVKSDDFKWFLKNCKGKINL